LVSDWVDALPLGTVGQKQLWHKEAEAAIAAEAKLNAPISGFFFKFIITPAFRSRRFYASPISFLLATEKIQ
jgi:hypothetical protein